MDEFVRLSDKTTIPRVIIGLWQIADMEKDGNVLNSENTTGYLNTYADNGFTAFDMADHYGSSEIIAGILKININFQIKLIYLLSGFLNQERFQEIQQEKL
jgi:predicted oxidoreductase